MTATPTKVVFQTSASRETCEQAAKDATFYHSYDLSNGVHIAGYWDISIDIADYRFPDVRGKRVLDVGPGSGWFAFYLESLGADVTVVESRGYGDFDVYGEDRYTGAQGREPDRVIDGRPVWFGPVSKSLLTMRDLLDSKVKFLNGRVYEVGPDMFPEPFDVVLMCALLPHLRDPVGALRGAHSVLKPGGLCVVTASTWTGHDDNELPMQMLPHTGFDRISWWIPNKAAFGHWFRAAGFKAVELESTLNSTPDAQAFVDGRQINAPMVVRLAHATA